MVCLLKREVLRLRVQSRLARTFANSAGRRTSTSDALVGRINVIPLTIRSHHAEYRSSISVSCLASSNKRLALFRTFAILRSRFLRSLAGRPSCLPPFCQKYCQASRERPFHALSYRRVQVWGRAHVRSKRQTRRLSLCASNADTPASITASSAFDFGVRLRFMRMD